MKKVEKPTADVGVIVGRFQVHELHEGQKDLIQSVCNMHDKVILFLGLSPLIGTQQNSLDFESRKQMILSDFSDVNILYIKDVNNDELWSKRLDEQISDIVGPNQTVVLYGSRDSFVKHYTTKRYETIELQQEVYISGTEVRKSISRKVKNSSGFRTGVIWGAYNRYPTTITTVDVAVFNEDNTKLLLARKPNETEYRFIGGFSDPNSMSFEQDARREVLEETGIEISDPKYVCSLKILDWRYKNEKDKIKTMFFKANIMFGKPEAADDICAVRWFDIDTLKAEQLVEEHQGLLEKLLENLDKSKK